MEWWVRHYFALFSIYSSRHPSGYDLLLLALAPMGNEDNLKKEDDLYEYLEVMLSEYGKTMANFVALARDNENTKKSFARRLRPTLVG